MSKDVNKEIVSKIKNFIHGNISDFLSSIKHLPEKERAQTMLKLLQIISENKESSIVLPPIYNIQFSSTGVSPIHNEQDVLNFFEEKESVKSTKNTIL